MMENLEKKLKDIHQLMEEALPHCSEVSDLADRLSLEGTEFSGIVIWMKNAFRQIENKDCFNAYIDGLAMNEAELEKLRREYVPKMWSFTLNKKAFLSSLNSEGGHLFFLAKSGFIKWLNALNPFHWKGSAAVTISVGGIKHPFGGPSFQVIPPALLGEVSPEWAVMKLPGDDKVRRHVRVAANDVCINPKLFAVSHLSGEEKIDGLLLGNSFLTLGASLAQEFFSRDKVLVKGYRTAEISLILNSEKPKLEEIGLLAETVEWVFEERTDTRMKLLADRLSLELSDQESWYSILCRHLREAFVQAREMYRFVILDRQDAYYRELRSLLGELQNQSKAYAAKIKSMTEGLFRDVLASLFLVAFGLFSKADIEKIGELLDNPYLLLLLKGLAIYLMVSYLFQLVNNWNDLRISTKACLRCPWAMAPN